MANTNNAYPDIYKYVITLQCAAVPTVMTFPKKYEVKKRQTTGKQSYLEVLCIDNKLSLPYLQLYYLASILTRLIHQFHHDRSKPWVSLERTLYLYPILSLLAQA